MNDSYKLFIDTQKKNKKNTHCVTFPLTQKGQHEAEELFENMKTEPTVAKLMLFRCDRDGRLNKLRHFEQGEKNENV